MVILCYGLHTDCVKDDGVVVETCFKHVFLISSPTLNKEGEIIWKRYASVHSCWDNRNVFLCRKIMNWKTDMNTEVNNNWRLECFCLGKNVQKWRVILKMMSLYSSSVLICETTWHVGKTKNKRISQAKKLRSQCCGAAMLCSGLFLYVYISAVFIQNTTDVVQCQHCMLIWNCKLDVGQNPNPADYSNETVKINGKSFSGCSSLKHLLLVFDIILILL